MASLKGISLPPISLDEAARILNVHKETLRRWDRSGKLKAIRYFGRGDRHYDYGEIVFMYAEIYLKPKIKGLLKNL